MIVGTSMGLVYVMEVQWHSNRSGWPVQMRHPVEQKVVVEDVIGDTNLEVFVVDTGGDVAALNSEGISKAFESLARKVLKRLSSTPQPISRVPQRL